MRIFFDSRHRTPSSASSSDFSLELLESVEIPRESEVRLHDVSIPYSWRTVEQNLNDHIYLSQEPATGPETYHRLTLPAGQYDGRALATAIGSLLNTVAPALWGNNPYVGKYNDQTGQLRITLANGAVGSFMLWPDLALRSNPNWRGFDLQRPQSFNKNLRLTSLQRYTAIVPFESQFLDLLTIHDVFVHCNLSRGSIGPSPGDRSCLAKVVVTSGYGYVIHQEGSSWEYAQCTQQIVKTISFQLRDAEGNLIPLHGCDWSGCLTFNDPPS
jgi:hypothetical protein